jgi:hypothetical protein
MTHYHPASHSIEIRAREKESRIDLDRQYRESEQRHVAYDDPPLQVKRWWQFWRRGERSEKLFG